MELTDKIKTQGSFKIRVIDADGNEDVYEDKNLIVDTARGNMARLLSGWDVGRPIDKLILGTRGHNPDTGNFLDPKQVGTFGFDTTRINTFSEAEDEFYYSIKFDSLNPFGPTFEVNDDGLGNPINWIQNDGSYSGTLNLYGKGNRYSADGTQESDENIACPIKIEVFNRIVKYSITVPESAANGPDGNSLTVFTEAALMAGEDLFSLKCFSARIKESTVKFIIEWSILF